jgi:YD repeat-containing protein
MVATHALSSPGGFAKKLKTRSLKSALRQRRHLATAAAATARDESKMAFSGQGEDAAFATLNEKFPAALAVAPDAIPSSDRVLKYVNDEHAAIVAPVDRDKASDEERKPRMVVSTLPLRVKNRDGQLAPLSTDVTESTPGELRPENALTEILVNRDLREGIEFPGTGVVVRATGGYLDQPATVRKNSVFWANVQTDTDLVVNMLPDGVETFDVLRSRQSPEMLSYEVELPEGGSLGLDDGTQAISINDKEGKNVVRIGPPIATDADGTEVATHWVVKGTVLQIAVDHRLADVRYPVLVDPYYVVDQLSWSTDSGIDFRGWSWTESNPNALVHAYDSGIGHGLNIYLPAGLTTPANLWGLWEFKAPGDTYVNRFEMAHFSYRPWGNRSCAAAGILGSDNPISWNTGQASTPLGNVPSPWGLCPNQSPGFVSNWYMTHTPTGGSVTRGNAAAFQWWAPNAASSPLLADHILLGGSYVQVTDDQAPGNFNISGLPSGWTKNKNLSFSAYATDYGLGMEYMKVNISGVLAGDQTLSCVPDWRDANHCPGPQRVDVIKDAPEGINNIDVYAEDASGGDSSISGNGGWDNMGFVARVDTVAPGTPELFGPAYDLKNQEVAEASYKVHVWGRDYASNPADLTTPVSGIGSQELLVDGVVVSTNSQGCGQPCLDGDGADLESDLTFNTSGVSLGQHELKVRQTDRAGNTRETSPWNLTVVSGTVTRPSPGTHVSRRATLEAHAVRSGISNVRWEYRTAASGSTPAGAWTTIPVTALRDGEGNQPSGTTLPVSGGDSAPVSWDIKGTPGLGNQSQSLDVRGVFNAGSTSPSRLLFDTKGLDGSLAQEQIGPGQVNMLTGNFSVVEDDVKVRAGLADLGVSRTYNSRDAATAGPLGPGWKFGAPALDTIDTAERVQEHLSDNYIEVTLGDGAPVPFFVAGSVNFTPAIGYERYSLKLSEARVTGSGWLKKYIMTDQTTGASIRFEADPGATTFYPASIRTGTTANALTVVNGTVGGKQRVKELYAPYTSGSGPTASEACRTTFTAQCRALIFVYATTTTATGSLPANWGNFAGQLMRVDFKTSTDTQPVSSYSYDSSGRLRASWDPRIATLKSQYGYDANGLLISVGDPGETPWTMSYTQIGGETERGRLSQVSRTVPAGSATWTMAYNLPLSGTNAPMDMSPSAVLASSSWGQVDLPTDATAIFPPDQVPALPTSNYTRASVSYLNRDGYEVNDLEPGGALSTTERDRYGNVIRELGAENRSLALSYSSSSGRATRSHELDTQRTYEDKGMNLTNEIGPSHNVRLDSGEMVLARRRTVTRYDETKPATDTTNYHLPTTQIVSAQVSGTDRDSRTTTIDYDWTLRKPTRTVKGAQAGGPALTEVKQYDSATGALTVHRMPRSPNSDAASTTKYSYYGTAGCNSHPEWYMRLCQRSPGAQPGGSQPALPTTTYQYNRDGHVTSEDRGGRVKSTTYDGAGRVAGIAWSGPGTAVPASTVSYDPDTGREATRAAVVNGSTRTIEQHYDDAGQRTEYVDGTEESTTTTYDLLGRRLVVDDGKGTQTNTYDAVTGRLKQIVDSQAGTFSATYDADGRVLTKTMPDGLRGTYHYDETGNAVDLAWVKTTGCSSACTWLHFDATYSIFDQMRGVNGTNSSKQFGYDGAGRLTFVRDTPAGQGCTTRRYTLDANSNRTKVQTYAPGSGGSCDSTSTPTEISSTYDGADRRIDSGFVYDAQGRTTTVPEGAEDALVSTFFADDLTRSQSQSDITNTYDLDPERRSMVRSRTSASGTGTETSHYSDSTDSPSWTATDDGHWSRNVSGIDGDLVATVDDSTGPVLQLTDLHGDVVATGATASTKLEDAQVLQVARSGSTWSADPTRPLAPGVYNARVRQNDASGNSGDSAVTRLTVGADAGALTWPTATWSWTTDRRAIGAWVRAVARRPAIRPELITAPMREGRRWGRLGC